MPLPKAVSNDLLGAATRDPRARAMEHYAMRHPAPDSNQLQPDGSGSGDGPGAGRRPPSSAGTSPGTPSAYAHPPQPSQQQGVRAWRGTNEEPGPMAAAAAAAVDVSPPTKRRPRRRSAHRPGVDIDVDLLIRASNQPASIQVRGHT